MPDVLASFRRWVEPPRHLLLALTAVTVLAAGAFGWLGWEMLRRDDAVEAQRQQERLEHAADLAVQALERRLIAIEERLAGFMSEPSRPFPVPEPGGVVVSVTATGVSEVLNTPLTAGDGKPTALLFRPVMPKGAEPAATLFAEGEAAEYQHRDAGRAARIFGELARADTPDVRAAALVRLARVLRASGHRQDALEAYDRLAAHADQRVLGVPASLVARHARLRILAGGGDQALAVREARALLADLAHVRWPLTRAQYEFYRDDIASMAGVIGAEDPKALGLAQAVDDLWREWQTGLGPAGRRTVRTGSDPLLIVWRANAERVVAHVVPVGLLLQRTSRDPTLALSLTDADGTLIAGTSHPGRDVIRMPADSRLPWVVHAQNATGQGGESRLTRGRLTVLGLAVMSCFLVTGTYLIGRAVRREMELSRLQTEFVSAVSHEFRTPLAAMRQLSEVLAAGRVPDPQRQVQYFEALAAESRRLQRLVETLLDFGRLQSGAGAFRMQPLSPRALVERVVADFRGQMGASACVIAVNGDDGCGQVLADPDAMGLALFNLLDNAVKYGGAEPSVEVSWGRHGVRIGLQVRDHGPGVPPEERARIFERFVRGSTAAATRVRGTGLGLALVKQIAAGHGGEVAVSPASGRGSVFTIWLPCAEEGRP